MKTSIYEQFNNDFNQVTSFVILHKVKENLERLATLNFIRKKSGTVYCYFHQIGFEAQKGKAGGGGYDKLSAAFYDAACKNYSSLVHSQAPESDFSIACKFLDAAKIGNGGSEFERALRDAGFLIFRAI